jgi:dolichol kinase
VRNGVCLYYYIISLVLFAAAFLAEYYTHKHFSVVGILAFVAFSSVYFRYQYQSLSISLIMLLSTALMYLYGKKRFRAFYLMLAVLALVFLLYVHFGFVSRYYTMAFGIGALYGIMMSGLESRTGIAKARKQNITAELNRDYLQILVGVIISIILIYTSILGTYISFYLVLLGLFGIAFSLNSRARGMSFFRSLEKDGVFFGRGAIFLAIGFTILLSLYPYSNIALFGILILLFCDPVATIMGLKFGKLKLPYNRKKSYAGTLSYFILGVLFGMLLIGYISIPIAFLLALLESLSNKIDDNVTVAVAYGIIGALIP